MTGPLQVIAVSFGPGAEFRGRVLAEVDRLQGRGMLRLLDLLVVAKTRMELSSGCQSATTRTSADCWRAFSLLMLLVPSGRPWATAPGASTGRTPGR